MPERNTRLDWRQREVVVLLGDHIERGMQKAVVYAAGQAKRKVNRSQPLRRAKSGRRYGLDPSRPGEPPKRVEGRLMQSIKGKVTRKLNVINGFIGTDVKYGKHLELGTRRMAARPYLRPTILENREAILRLVARG